MHTLYAIMQGEDVVGYLAALEHDNEQAHDQIVRRLEQLADHGPSRRKNEFNVLGDGLYEAKAKSGPRVIFFYDQNSIVICAHAFDKQGQKTRRKDLDIARSRKRSYFERKRSGQGFMILTDKGTPPPERQP